MSAQLRNISYNLDLDGVDDLTSTMSGRTITIRPRALKLVSYDGGATVGTAGIEGRQVRKSDGRLGNVRWVAVGPCGDVTPDYVAKALVSLGLVWAVSS